jgi:pimeloyl-ACP methyl ester carboxylesterase
MLTAERDPGLRPEFADGMPALCSDLELHLVKNVAHWVPQEAPDVLNGHLIAWLKRVAQTA